MERRVCAAVDCINTFIPKFPRHIFCSEQCRSRSNRRMYAKERVKKGLCPQCGGPMDYPTSSHHNKVSPKYCSKCQKYYKERYQNKKAIKNI